MHDIKPLQAFRYPLVLASTSPRRHELLTQVQLMFTTASVDIDEATHDYELPHQYVMRLAEQKAKASFNQYQTPAIIIGADTTVTIEGIILAKPDSKAHAIEMWKLLSGRTHQVYTGVCVLSPEKSDVFYVTTDVTFKALTLADMDVYWASGEPVGKAGAYAIQGLGASWISHISGSYSNVVGLPLFETLDVLGFYK